MSGTVVFHNDRIDMGPAVRPSTAPCRIRSGSKKKASLKRMPCVSILCFSMRTTRLQVAKKYLPFPPFQKRSSNQDLLVQKYRDPYASLIDFTRFGTPNSLIGSHDLNSKIGIHELEFWPNSLIDLDLREQRKGREATENLWSTKYTHAVLCSCCNSRRLCRAKRHKCCKQTILDTK